MGRPKMTREKYLEKYCEVISSLNLGKTIRAVAEEQELGISTVMRLKKEFGIITPVKESKIPKYIGPKKGTKEWYIERYGYVIPLLEEGKSAVSISQEHNVSVDTILKIKRKFGIVTPKIERVKKEKQIGENFQPIDVDVLNEWRALAPTIYDLQKRWNNTSCQFVRSIEDADIAESIGVQEINVHQHGADGRKDGEIFYEHKNQNQDNLDIDFSDLSLERVNTFCNGVLTVGTKWVGFLQKKYSVIFNSKNVGDIILDGQANFRKTAHISFNTLLENGAKVIAWDGNISEAYKDIKSMHPYSNLNITDIYGPQDAKMVANMVMEVEE